jgi:transcriptional regulator with XRE-family HTH domain
MAFQLGECLLLQRLKAKNMSPAEFARRMKVSRQYVHKLISGEDTMSLEFAINAAHILECRVTDLYVLNIVKSRRE